MSPTAGSPPNGYMASIPSYQSSNTYNNGDRMVSMQPPEGLSPNDSPPANGFAQVQSENWHWS